MSYNIICQYDDEKCSDYLDETVKNAITKVLDYLGKNDENLEISVVFADIEEIQDLNRRFRNVDKPTNVLSFPNDGIFLGDIVLCYDVIRKEALEQNKMFDSHMIHLVVHSILHLLGYDHISDDEAEEMEALEIKILDEVFGIANPYLT